ncbi:MAG: hypothetical protein GF331_08370 [Chitinivibrionales bacterium]|nr:hypothetical protein [Chitinivibrionales bacterium]
MLYPQDNAFRRIINLNGIWRCALDPKGDGEDKGFAQGLPGDRLIAVPGSWNEQANDLYHYNDRLWYERSFVVPHDIDGKRVSIRFGCATFAARVFLNGEFIGSDDTGYLPFELDVTERVKRGEENRLSVAVDGFPRPTEQAIGQGDFYEYAGLSRPVSVCIVDQCHITDIHAKPSLDGSAGRLAVELGTAPRATRAVVILDGIEQEMLVNGGAGSVELTVPDVRPWSCESPHLYTLRVVVYEGEQARDEYYLPIGFRTIAIEGRRVLLNGKPISLLGFGKHEDFHLVGRGLVDAINNRDMDLMKWCGANSFRTSHYPYGEEIYDLADRYGILIISEAPFVGFDDKQYTSESLTEKSNEMVRRLVARDKNHPSVIAWSIGNESNSCDPVSVPYYKSLMQTIRKTDERPIMYVGWTPPDNDHIYGLVDLIGVNRYYGWYALEKHGIKAKPGDIVAGVRAMERCLDQFAELYDAPIVVSEFGADTVAGMHSMWDLQFTEEFQTRYLEELIKLFRTKSYIAGMHIWNFADFYTNQSPVRMVGNRKGLFTRERQPKQAAFMVRRLWAGADDMGLFCRNEVGSRGEVKETVNVLGTD